jgi:hypothetical protein
LLLSNYVAEAPLHLRFHSCSLRNFHISHFWPLRSGTSAFHPLDLLGHDLLLPGHILGTHADSILQPGLGGQLQRLLRRGSPTDDGFVAVEVLGDLLEGSVAGLDVEEVDSGQLDGEPYAVEDVVFPSEVVECDGIDVLVEEDCEGLIFGTVREEGGELT